MLKNTAGQRIGAQLVSATDGSAFTGAATVYVTGDAGAQAVGSVGSGACVHEGNGYHTYAPAQAETNYDLAAFTFVGSGAVPVTVQVYTRAGDAFTRLGAPAGASIAADIASVQADTNDLQTRVPAALVGGRIDASVGAMAANVLTAAATAADFVTEVQGAAAAALTAYDPPTNAEMEARTLAAASYATAAAVDDLPTNAELATALGTADDAVLARLGAPAGASIAADIAAVHAKTTNLPSDPADQSLIIAATDAVMARLGAPAGASIAADIAAIDAGTAPTAAEIADEVQTRTIAAVTTVNGLAANVITAASIAADAGAEIRTGLATSAELATLATTAQLQSVRLSAAGVTDILRTALTESYAENGDPMTLSQALYMIFALLANRRVQADVLRTYGLDGATQVMTFLLDDVATPTEQFRQS